MDIVLVQPKAGAYESLGTRLPDSLLSVASMPFENGYKIKLIDQRVDSGWKSELLHALKSNPLCIGTTAMTGAQIYHALEVSKLVKQNSNIPVVWGGVHPSLLPEQTLGNENIDIVVQGEGEITFFELVKTLENGRQLSAVDGIWYKKGGEIKKTSPRPFIKNLDILPEKPYSLINLNNYYGFSFGDKKSITLETSRGCPYRCKFCYNLAYNKRMWRGYSAKRTLEKIKYIVEELKIKGIYVQDDNFCANLRRYEDIVNGILREKLDIIWGLLGARADSIEKMPAELLEKTKKAGCRHIDIGVESGSPRLLEMIQKDETIPQIIAVNRKLSNFDFKIKLTFIIGFPTETEDETRQTVHLALKLQKENKNAFTPLYIYTPYPGTPLFDLALENGFRPPETLEGWARFTFLDWYLNYPSWLSKKRIKILDNLAFTALFSNRNIKHKIKKKWMRLLFDLYNPIARFRFENNFYHFPIERMIEKKLTNFPTYKLLAGRQSKKIPDED